MRKIHVIFNPHADGGRTADRYDEIHRLISDAIEEAEEEYSITWKTTEYARHALELVRDSLTESPEILIAVGGDGTLHEITNILMSVPESERPLIGIIPAGTGNDFAFNAGLEKDGKKSVETIFQGKPHAVDAMLVRDQTGRTWYWINTMGIGFSGSVSVFSHTLTKLKGFVKYLYAIVTTIVRYLDTMKLEITIDGERTFTDDSLMLAINNGPREAGGFPTAPDAEIDDGLITYMLAREMSGWRFLTYLPVVMKEEHLNHPDYFYSDVAKKMHIRSDIDMVIHTDGELFGKFNSGIREIEVEVLPAALKIFTPN